MTPKAGNGDGTPRFLGVGMCEASNLGNFKLDFVCCLQLHICTTTISSWLAVCLCVFTDSRTWAEEINACADMAVRATDRQTYLGGTMLFLLWELLGNTDCDPGKWQSLIQKREEDNLGLVMVPVGSERTEESSCQHSLPSCLFPSPLLSPR